MVPEHIGDGDRARENHVFDMIGVGHVLGPDIALTAEDVVTLVVGDFFRHDNIVPDLPQGQNCGNRGWFAIGVLD